MGKLLKFFRYFWFGLVMASGGIIGLSFSWIRPFHKNNSYPIAIYVRWLINPVFGLKYIIENHQFAYDYRPYVQISNHQNNFDIVLAANTVPPGVVSLGKREILFFPIFGLYYWLAGHILIDRSNRKKAFESMNRVNDSITKLGKSVWIMPEGTRSKGRGVLPFKKGAFHTAVKAQCPIVPVAVSTFHKGVNLERLTGNTILVKYCEPILTKGMGPEDVHQLKEDCEKLIREEVAALDEKLESIMNKV